MRLVGAGNWGCRMVFHPLWSACKFTHGNPWERKYDGFLLRKRAYEPFLWSILSD